VTINQPNLRAHRHALALGRLLSFVSFVAFCRTPIRGCLPKTDNQPTGSRAPTDIQPQPISPVRGYYRLLSPIIAKSRIFPGPESPSPCPDSSFSPQSLSSLPGRLETALKSTPADAGPWHRTPGQSYDWRIRGDVGLEEEVILSAVVNQPADFLKRPDNRSASVVFKFSRFAAKRYCARTLRERAKCLFRGSRAQQAARWAARLASLGIPTISPVAVAVRHWRPWDSYLISEYIAERSSIHQYAKAASSEERRWLVSSLANVMARLHSAGIAHRDAHLANFIVTRGAVPALVLVDLDGLRSRRSISVSSAAHDLGRLLDYSPGTTREHLRFLATYARRREPPVSSREVLQQLKRQRRGPGPMRMTNDQT
jgi:tRNA A-37 threonylcarbamoyl transferase component Bud32